MSITASSVNPKDLLGVYDSSFSDTCLGSALDDLFNVSETRRVNPDNITVVRGYLASLSMCLADLHRDKFNHLHTDEDEADALTLLASISQLVSWIEREDSNIRYLMQNPDLAQAFVDRH